LGRQLWTLKDIIQVTSTFAELGLAEPIMRALTAANYVTPTPIQSMAIPSLLEGRNLLGIAQTGTGKTAAFALPILHHLTSNMERTTPRSARALIMAPTRELACQISDSFKAYGRFLGLRQTSIFGGVSQNAQVKAMARGVDILIATPGRLLDLIDQGHVRLDQAKILVLDEADRMLDMGFIRDVKKIISTMSKERQSLLFSATMPGEVEKLANEILKDPVRVEVAATTVTVDRIDQRLYYVEASNKRNLLSKLLEDPELARVIVFTRTKHGANRVAEQLEKSGIAVEALHGNKSQNARQAALNQFRNGKARVLVATDIASRGIDVTGVTHVINFELPHEPESYVHRVGRTARAGTEGIALSFCDASERSMLRGIEKLTRRPLTVVGDMPASFQHASSKPPARGGNAGRGGYNPTRDRDASANPRSGQRNNRKPFAGRKETRAA
jgi:ATP-dependent RNA helicase RhlE